MNCDVIFIIVVKQRVNTFSFSYDCEYEHVCCTCEPYNRNRNLGNRKNTGNLTCGYTRQIQELMCRGMQLHYIPVTAFS